MLYVHLYYPHVTSGCFMLPSVINGGGYSKRAASSLKCGTKFALYGTGGTVGIWNSVFGRNEGTSWILPLFRRGGCGRTKSKSSSSACVKSSACSSSSASSSLCLPPSSPPHVTSASLRPSVSIHRSRSAGAGPVYRIFHHRILQHELTLRLRECLFFTHDRCKEELRYEALV